MGVNGFLRPGNPAIEVGGFASHPNSWVSRKGEAAWTPQIGFGEQFINRCFVERLQFFHTPPSFVEWLRFRTRLFLRNSVCKQPSSNVWFVLDWHSIHELSIVNRAVRMYVNSPRARALLASELGYPPGIGFAWRCSGRRLVTITRLTRADGGRGGRRTRGGSFCRIPMFSPS